MKIYLSHSIRGQMGQDATTEFMAENNKKALAFLQCLKTFLPQVKWYLPGELDGFLIPRGVNLISIVEALLTLDCAIIKQSDGMVVFTPDDYISGGMQKEIDFATENSIPMFYYNPELFKGQTNSYVANKLTEWIKTIERKSNEQK
jgi:hypothetical protein